MNGSTNGRLRSLLFVVAIGLSMAVPACRDGGGGSGTSGTCNPVCDSGMCQQCVNGACQSLCAADEVCLAGQCVPDSPSNCQPACDAFQCETCVDGSCTAQCASAESCVAGVCVIVDTSCDPACDAAACEACVDGSCQVVCAADEECTGGLCQSTTGGLTVYDLQDNERPGHPAPESDIELAGVIVTAIDGQGYGEGSFWVAEPAGGAYSGIYVFNRPELDVSELAVGDRVALSGTYTEYEGLSEIVLAELTVEQAGVGAPAPSVVAPADVANDGAEAEAYEGVLVRVEDVAVTNLRPDDPDDFGEFEITGGLRVDDEIFEYEASAGEQFASLTGVMHFGFGNRKLLVRSPGDVSGGDCDPACDSAQCEVCRDGECVAGCSAGQTCDGAGNCTGTATITVYDLQDESRPGHPTSWGDVALEGVMVTAIDTLDYAEGSFWVQEITGGPYSGIYVFNRDAIDIAALGVGTLVDLEGFYKEYEGLSEIVLSGFEVVGTSADAPAPEAIANPASIATGGEDAEAYEGVLVQVSGVVALSDTDQHGEFRVTGDLIVNDDMYAYDATTGDAFTTLTGILHYGFSNHFLAPRDAGDIVEGEPPVCAPACDANACEVCVGGDCVVSCSRSEICEEGACVPWNPPCEPACGDGQICIGGECVAGGETTIQAIQDGTIPGCQADCPVYTITGAVVVATDDLEYDDDTFYVMDPSSEDGRYAGVMVRPYTDATVSGTIAEGALVDLTFEVRQNSKGTNLRASVVTVTGSGTVPLPTLVAPADIAHDGADTAMYEGVLVRVENVWVTNANPDEPEDYNVFELDDGVWVDDELYAITPDPVVDVGFSYIQGVVRYSFGSFKLCPRRAEDAELD